MDLKEIMNYKTYVVLGSTDNEEKYAYKINQRNFDWVYADNDCLAVGVPKDYQSIDEVPFEFDVLDFCINPKFGLELLKNSTKNIKAAVFQPGAENQDIENILKEKNIPFIKGCLLVGCSLYGKK